MTHYQLLGVTPDTDTKTIAKAYRKLARALHPDTNPDPEAQTRLAAISDAYAVLSHPDRRAEYDRGLARTPAGSSPVPHAQDTPAGEALSVRQHGSDLYTTVHLTAAEAAAGSSRTIAVEYRTGCGRCRGTGFSAHGTARECHACYGLGMHPVTGRSCEMCVGRGSVTDAPCESCAGSRTVAARGTVTVALPAGVRDRQRVRVSRKGAPGPGGTSGDLYVDVTVTGTAPDLYLTAPNGADLGLVVPVRYTELRGGAKISVPLPDGNRGQVTVPPGSQPGAVVTVPGAGLPRPDGTTGDLHVRLDLAYPPGPPVEAERDLIARLAAHENERWNPREGLWPGR